jgi:phage shock protein A
MGIFDRMGKVVSSNINALLDKGEDPRKSLNLIVDEMTDQIRAAKKEVVEALGAEKVLGKKVAEADEEVAKWERRAELALKSEDEKLARDALKQKKRVTAERDRAEATRAEQRGVVLNMKKELERMEAKLEELKARKGTIAGEMKRAKAEPGDALAAGPGGGAFAEFRRMEDKIDQRRAEVAAHSEVEEALSNGNMSDAQVEAKFAALEGGRGGPGGDADMDDEIARLKKKLRIE